MHATPDIRFAAHLDRLADRIEHLRELDLALEDELQQALDESRDALGALTHYRRLLRRAADYAPRPLRRVA